MCNMAEVEIIPLSRMAGCFAQSQSKYANKALPVVVISLLSGL
jgi:hypothetical protein